MPTSSAASPPRAVRDGRDDRLPQTDMREYLLHQHRSALTNISDMDANCLQQRERGQRLEGCAGRGGAGRPRCSTRARADRRVIAFQRR